MQVNRPGLLNQILPQADLARMQVGQRLQVEILSMDANQEGIIDLGGKLVRAKLDTQVQTGERFWAAVKEANENGIVLSRQSLQNPKLDNLNKEQIITLVNRGFGFDPEISETLAKFMEGKGMTAFLSLLTSNHPQIRNLVALWLSALPNWSKLSGKNSETLLKYFSILGLDDENKMWNSFQTENQTLDLSASVKRNILSILQDQTDTLSKEEESALEKIRDSITGQQLWIQTGTKKNAYCLLHLVLQDQGMFYNCEIAMESARKGQRIDEEHSHIALQVETQNLGKIGADIMIYEHRINLCILHEDAEALRPMIQEMEQHAKGQFDRFGLTMERITIKAFDESPYFNEFITGKQQSGVDIQG